jgi:hypothetical protein
VLLAFGACIGIGLLTLPSPDDRAVLIAFDGQLLAFLVFLCGISAFFRTRAEGATVPRLLLVLTIVTATIGPWIALGITGFITHTSDGALALGAPSPAYAFVLAEEMGRSSASLSSEVMAAILCSTGYALFGVGLLAMAAGRAHTRIAKERARVAELEAMLDAELQAEQEAAQTAVAAPLAAPEPEPGTP